MIRSVTVSLMLIFLMLPSENISALSALDEKQVEFSMRKIGHELLLSAADSTSRVMPIIKDSNQYIIQFENDFEFNPDILVNTANNIIKADNLAEGYVVEVLQCDSDEVIYSYKIDDLKEVEDIPCVTRNQPNSCYTIKFTLIHHTEEASETEETKFNPLYLIPILWLLFLLIYIIRRRKNKTKTDPNMISLGKYHFDQRNATLIMEEQRIELTNKEADLLLLLHETVNTTVEREVILNKVWGDEGDYIGRTLDVFISKLRKKLEADPDVKIVNVRGVGYKLTINS
ncbi:MAG: response regulator transcription factor [Chitinophagales bacterium]|nr:response regulator transcription factor [Chitinophagales bacterium]